MGEKWVWWVCYVFCGVSFCFFLINVVCCLFVVVYWFVFIGRWGEGVGCWVDVWLIVWFIVCVFGCFWKFNSCRL